MMVETVGFVSFERRASSVREMRPPRRTRSMMIDRLTSRMARLSPLSNVSNFPNFSTKGRTLMPSQGEDKPIAARRRGRGRGAPATGATGGTAP